MRQHATAYEHSRTKASLFFFSSRRRHTRWPRDWSSDVCSSDLGDEAATAEAEGGRDGDEAQFVLADDKPRDRRCLGQRADQHGLEPADAIRDPTPELPAQK